MPANPSTKNAHEQLITNLLNNLPAGYTSATVKLPNRNFNTPLDTKWLRPTVLVQISKEAEAGGGWTRDEGEFIIDTFYPIGGDDLAQLAEAETIAALYRNKELNGVKCQESLVNINAIETSWYNVQITTNFYYEGAK